MDAAASAGLAALSGTGRELAATKSWLFAGAATRAGALRIVVESTRAAVEEYTIAGAAA
jgi:hypothetical protein